MEVKHTTLGEAIISLLWLEPTQKSVFTDVLSKNKQKVPKTFTPGGNEIFPLSLYDGIFFVAYMEWNMSDENHMYLRQVVVNTSQRAKGYGREVLRICKEICKKQGYSMILVEPEGNSQSYWEMLGFKYYKQNEAKKPLFYLSIH